jgi:hypothetical protein
LPFEVILSVWLDGGSQRARSGVEWKETLMFKRLGFMFLCVVCLVAQPSFADDRDKLIGTWKLESYEVEVQAPGQKGPVMGDHPTGYVAFLPEGRVFFVLTGEARKPAKTDQERAGLLNTLVAYTGTYRVEGDKWITKVEVAWNPEWVGTEQARSFKLDGERLQVLTPWRIMPNWADKGMTRSSITFERAK